MVQTALHVQQRLGSLGRQLHKAYDPEQDRDQSVTSSRNAGTTRAGSLGGLARSERVNLQTGLACVRWGSMVERASRAYKDAAFFPIQIISAYLRA